jgi:hypothetical protein
VSRMNDDELDLLLRHQFAALDDAELGPHIDSPHELVRGAARAARQYLLRGGHDSDLVSAGWDDFYLALAEVGELI